MHKQLAIREFHAFKTAELFAVFRHIYLTSDFMSDDFDRKFPGIEAFSNHHHSILRKHGSFILIATLGERIVGYLILNKREASRLHHTADLNMGVAENFRNRGIGKTLLNAALNKVKADGVIEIIYLMVRADHTGAVKLYANAGFEKIVRLEKDTKIGHEYYDGILMRRFV